MVGRTRISFCLQSSLICRKNHFIHWDILRYIEDIQNAIIEQVSRISDMLKRTSRMTAIRSSELENNPEIGEILRTGRDGEFIGVEDLSSIRELNWGSVPGDVYNYFQMMMGMEQEIAALAPQKPGDSETATEASIVAAASQINGNWMEAAVNEFYENIVRNAFQIMGDPRYTPENFVENISPEGDQRVVRALTTSDFLYNYRIETKVGSTQPLYAQLERDRTMAFVGWASNRPNYDQMEIDKLAAEANGIQDVDKVLVDQDNVEAQRAAQYENDRVMVGQGIEVLPQQDHTAHMEVHNMYREHPQYIQLMQQAQSVDMVGNPANPQAGQQIQTIDQAMGQHVMQHQQAMEQEQQGETTLGGGAEAVQVSQTQPDLISQVQSNAQRTADSIQNQTEGM
jgi:hypothetical protein